MAKKTQKTRNKARRPSDPNSIEAIQWEFWNRYSIKSGIKEYKAQPKAKYVIYPFLHENQKMICVAPSGSGKSIIGLSIASCMALGDNRTLFKYWKFPHRYKVVYLQFDMPHATFYRRYVPLNNKLLGLKKVSELNQHLTVICRDEIRKSFPTIRSYKNLDAWRTFLKTLSTPDVVFIDNIAAMPGGLRAFASNSEEFNQFLDLFEEMKIALFIQHHTNTAGREYGGIINHVRMDFAILAHRPKDWVRRDGVSLRIGYAKDRSDPNAELPSVHISIADNKWQTVEIDDPNEYMEKARDKLLIALKNAPKGLTKRDIANGVYQANVPTEKINEILADLLSAKKIISEKAKGRKGFRYYDPTHAPSTPASAPPGTVVH